MIDEIKEYETSFRSVRKIKKVVLDELDNLTLEDLEKLIDWLRNIYSWVE